MDALLEDVTGPGPVLLVRELLLVEDIEDGPGGPGGVGLPKVAAELPILVFDPVVVLAISDCNLLEVIWG